MRLRFLTPLIALGVALSVPAVAHGQEATAAVATTTTTTPTVTTTTPTTTTPAPKPEPEPKPKPLPRGTISSEPVGANGSLKALLAGDTLTVRGKLSIYVPGQRVVVRITRGGKKVVTKDAAVKKSGKSGTYSVSFTAKGSGTWAVSALHPSTDEQRLLKARTFHVQVLDRSVSAGESGTTVKLLQIMLKRKGYVTGQYGVYDARTQRAVQAFRKMTNMSRTFVANEGVFQALQAGKGAFAVRYKNHGRHVEADLTHQVLALINSNGSVARLYTTSSGKPSTPTVLGSYRVYMREPGTNSHGMVFSSYFIRGYAIHGYAEVPSYPASHGCLRVPVPDAVPIWNWIGGTGMPVDVYYR